MPGSLSTETGGSAYSEMGGSIWTEIFRQLNNILLSCVTPTGSAQYHSPLRLTLRGEIDIIPYISYPAPVFHF
jgi:hypothetical protein